MRRFATWRMKPAARYPADPRAVFILGLCVFAGVPMILLQVEPGSIEDLLPAWAVALWGVSLVGGAILTLGGMARDSIEGIIVEQVGSVLVGCASIIYSAGAVFAIGIQALLPSAIVLGWGLSCIWRWAQLEALLEKSYRIKVKILQDEEPICGDDLP